MTKFTKITLLTLTSMLLCAGCGASEKNSSSSKNDTVETTQSVEKTSTTKTEQSGETVEFFATGDYEAGVDIEPGSYYIVLTDIQPNDNYKDYQAYVTVTARSSSSDSKIWETIEEVGKPYRVNLEEGDKIRFSDGYDPTGWTVTFFTADDYKEYQKSEKK